METEAIWKKYRYPTFVGLFLLIGLIILITFIFTLGSQQDTFIKAIEVQAQFHDVGGLKKGDRVWLSGVQVGAIREISIIGKNKVRVNMSVEQGIDSLIRSDSKVRIGSDGVMGNRIIIISPGSSVAAPYQSGTLLNAEPSADMHQLVQYLASSGQNLSVILDNLKKITTTINEGDGLLHLILDDSILSENISSSATSIRLSSEQARLMLTDGRAVSERLSDLLLKISSKGMLAGDLLSDTVLYTQLLTTMHELRQSSEHIKNMTEKADLILAKSEKSGSVLSVLMEDRHSGETLTSILANLDSASRKLNEDLLAVRKSFLLRKYFRNKEKR